LPSGIRFADASCHVTLRYLSPLLDLRPVHRTPSPSEYGLEASAPPPMRAPAWTFQSAPLFPTSFRNLLAREEASAMMVCFFFSDLSLFPFSCRPADLHARCRQWIPSRPFSSSSVFPPLLPFVNSFERALAAPKPNLGIAVLEKWTSTGVVRRLALGPSF